MGQSANETEQKYLDIRNQLMTIKYSTSIYIIYNIYTIYMIYIMIYILFPGLRGAVEYDTYCLSILFCVGCSLVVGWRVEITPVVQEEPRCQMGVGVGGS